MESIQPYPPHHDPTFLIFNIMQTSVKEKAFIVPPMFFNLLDHHYRIWNKGAHEVRLRGHHRVPQPSGGLDPFPLPLKPKGDRALRKTIASSSDKETGSTEDKRNTYRADSRE
ncbi:hypothetical protein AVEN_242685-1 [Araneus ventricosus]|uniref:Uncharacterized protein n=1 Tax=Araneus ventricosus TaxID=182803 RepID=A0A4Y2DYN2_ARAVE|nr:hypothetical protein AVEN_242685-1 [Araneus ventricosus]